MPTLEITGKIVMAVEIPTTVHFNKPGTAAGTTSHITGNGNDSATCMWPGFTS